MSFSEPTLKDTSFSCLVETCEELAELRREYAAVSKAKRRKAADFQYHAAGASQLFNNALGRANDESAPWPGEVAALAIDPQYAPAMLTVASYEYLYGRIAEAMNLFFALVALPKNTEDLHVIIDKAGDFLIDSEDYENAMALYASAISKHPNAAIYYIGLSYCLGQRGKFEEAIAQARKAVDLEPNNHQHLTDLGWSLVEAEHYEEARPILERAVSLAPPDYQLAKGNLEELSRRMKNKGGNTDIQAPEC